MAPHHIQRVCRLHSNDNNNHSTTSGLAMDAVASQLNATSSIIFRCLTTRLARWTVYVMRL